MTPDRAFNIIIFCVGIGLMYVSGVLYVNLVRHVRVNSYLDLFFMAILAIVASAGSYLMLSMAGTLIVNR